MSQKRYNCLVVDDEVLGRELIENHLSQFDQFTLVASCGSAIEASKYLSSHSIDLIFLDIEMPIMKGTDFYKSLADKPQVIFTTAYRDYAVDGFELEAVDYLLKPIVFPRFFKAVQRFLANKTRNESTIVRQTAATPADYLFVRADRKDVKLRFADILYVQSLKDYIRIHMLTEAITVKGSISGFAKRLNTDFIRVHRSYVVNRRHVTALTNNDAEIGDIEIPIGDKYRTEALKNL